MSERLKMTPYQHFTVLRHDPGVLELDAVWGPSPKKAPKQLHPSQEEQFDVVAGELTVRLDGDVHVFGAGSSFTIPAGAVHGVWNGGAVEARAVWRTLPALRTLELFEDIDGLYRSGVVGVRRDAQPDDVGDAVDGVPRRPAPGGQAGVGWSAACSRCWRASAAAAATSRAPRALRRGRNGHGLTSGVGNDRSSPPSSLRSPDGRQHERREDRRRRQLPFARAHSPGASRSCRPSCADAPNARHTAVAAALQQGRRSNSIIALQCETLNR